MANRTHPNPLSSRKSLPLEREVKARPSELTAGCKLE